jgi:hypothetical protein
VFYNSTKSLKGNVNNVALDRMPLIDRCRRGSSIVSRTSLHPGTLTNPASRSHGCSQCRNDYSRPGKRP